MKRWRIMPVERTDLLRGLDESRPGEARFKSVLVSVLMTTPNEGCARILKDIHWGLFVSSQNLYRQKSANLRLHHLDYRHHPGERLVWFSLCRSVFVCTCACMVWERLYIASKTVVIFFVSLSDIFSFFLVHYFLARLCYRYSPYSWPGVWSSRLNNRWDSGLCDTKRCPCVLLHNSGKPWKTMAAAPTCCFSLTAFYDVHFIITSVKLLNVIVLIIITYNIKISFSDSFLYSFTTYLPSRTDKTLTSF